jgi:hypothetical protein
MNQTITFRPADIRRAIKALSHGGITIVRVTFEGSRVELLTADDPKVKTIEARDAA